MKCSNCGKANKVVINGKAYCADCGEPMTAKPAAPKPSTKKAAHSKHHAQKSTQQKAHVLDLSQTAAARQKPSVNAQTIHGVRKDTPVALKKPAEKVTSAAKVQPASKQMARVLRAKNTPRAKKITKFSAKHLTNYQAEKATQAYKAESAMHMTPHQTYQLGKAATQAQTTQSTGPAAASSESGPKTNQPGALANFLARFSQPRFATVAAVAGCFLLLAGYITYLNYPRLQLRVAASKAGFDAQLPRYTPAGYGLSSPVSTSKGQVTIRFNSHGDGSTLALAQRETNWDSASLLENYVKPKSNDYLTFQQNGLTIYVYNSNQAAWVNSGVFYTLEGDSHLSSEQLIKIATSI